MVEKNERHPSDGSEEKIGPPPGSDEAEIAKDPELDGIGLEIDQTEFVRSEISGLSGEKQLAKGLELIEKGFDKYVAKNIKEFDKENNVPITNKLIELDQQRKKGKISKK